MKNLRELVEKKLPVIWYESNCPVGIVKLRARKLSEYSSDVEGEFTLTRKMGRKPKNDERELKAYYILN